MTDYSDHAGAITEPLRWSVLVVDDEEGMREGIRRVLERHAYTVRTADDGEEAIALLESCRFDIALVDLKMPGITGLELTRHVCTSCGGRTVVVIVSAFASVEAAVEAMRQGAFDFLVKPFTPDDLLRVVERASDQRKLVLERDAYSLELTSEQTLSRQLINSMWEGLVVLNDERRPVLMNTRAEYLLAVSLSDGMTFESLELSNEVGAAVDRIYAAAEPAGTVDTVTLERTGRELIVRLAPYMRDRELAGLMLFLRPRAGSPAEPAGSDGVTT